MTQGHVRGSKYELMRVFQNLFKNSLEAGATRLLVAVSHNNGQLEITISDNGSGMDADRVKRALHGGFSSKANGTGLGLSICRHLVGSHGATFGLESTLGKGTTISLVFPAAHE
jgi:signal transduction histidine kinase